MFEQEIESIAAGGSNEEIYYNLLNLTKKAIDRKGRIEGKKKVYYISAEFLIGKLLSNNLINLGLYDTVNEALKKHGKTMATLRRSSRSHPLVTEVWDVWQRASWIPLQHWDCRETVLVSITTLAYLSRCLRRTCRRRQRIHGFRIRAGFAERMSVIRLFLITRRYSL